MSGMRTTIRLKGELLEMAKRKAASQGRTLTALIEDAVRTELAKTPKSKPIKLPVVDGQGLQPGVDINDMGATQDLMDDLEPR